MAERRCIFCGRRIDLDRHALFRLPPDYKHIPDNIYQRYLTLHGISDKNSNLPDVCGAGSPESAGIEWEKNKPVLMTRTGRSTDTLICPSCHNEVFRDTDEGRVNTAVFFGRKDCGRTSLITAMAGECVTRQFSPDDRFRYIFNEKIYDPEFITGQYDRVRSGEKPSDLREPTAIYRVTGAGAGWNTVCDVMHDVSDADFTDEEALYTCVSYAADAAHYVYCVPVDKLAEQTEAPTELNVMLTRLDIYKMMSAFRYSQVTPTLNIAVTKLDLAAKLGGAAADLLSVKDNEQAMKNYLFAAFPCIEELSGFFTGVRVHAVSAVSTMSEQDDAGLLGKLYSELFG